MSALSEIGEHSLARDLCQKLLGYASPLHLYAEEIDPRSGRHLGNFPQAFTHLALINAVMHVIRADEKLAAGVQPLSRAERDCRARTWIGEKPEARRRERRMRSARAFLRPPVLACSAPRLTALSISETSLRCSASICASSPPAEAVSSRRKYVLICRRVVPVLEPLALRTLVALDLGLDVGHTLERRGTDRGGRVL